MGEHDGRSWFRSIGQEQALPCERCRAPRCEMQHAVTDAVCRTHDHFLLFGQWDERHQGIVLMIGRLLVVGSVVLAKLRSQDWPLVTTCVVVAGMVVLMHLRRLLVARTLFMAVFAGVSVAVAVLVGRSHRIVVLVLAALLAVLVAGAVPFVLRVLPVSPKAASLTRAGGAYLFRRPDGRPNIAGAVAVASMYVATLALLAEFGLWLSHDHDHRVVVLTARVVFSAISVGTVAVLSAAVLQEIRSHRDLPVRALLGPPTPIRPMSRRAPLPVADLADASPLVRAVGRLQVRLRNGVDVFVTGTVNLMVLFANGVVRGLVGTVNALAATATKLQRRLVATVTLALRGAEACGRLALAVLVRYYRHVAAPTVAAVAVVFFARRLGVQLGTYVAHGGWAHLWRSAALAAAVGALVVAAVWLPSGGTLRSAAVSVGRTASVLGPTSLLVFVATAWPLGLAGVVGIGRFRIGPLTLVGSAVIAAAVIAQPHRRPTIAASTRAPVGDPPPPDGRVSAWPPPPPPPAPPPSPRATDAASVTR